MELAHTLVIVVGVDDTPGGQAALEFAVREAVARAGTVTVVTAWDWGGTGTDSPVRGLRLRHVTGPSASKTGDRQDTSRPPARASDVRRVVENDAAHVLVQAAKDGDYLVVGTGHKGRFRRVFLGSVSGYCVQHADCPVVVIPPFAERQAA